MDSGDDWFSAKETTRLGCEIPLVEVNVIPIVNATRRGEVGDLVVGRG